MILKSLLKIWKWIFGSYYDQKKKDEEKINAKAGDPRENESKEEYVKRGLEVVKRLLKEKLK